MQDLISLGLYELVAQHPPPPVEELALTQSSPHAQRTFRQVAMHFLAWVERDPYQVDSIIVGNYAGEMLLHLPLFTIALRIRIIRELYDLAVAAGHIAANPASTAWSPPCQPDLGAHLHAHAEIALSSQAPTLSDQRDRAMLALRTELDLDPGTLRALTVSAFTRSETSAWLIIEQARLPVSHELALAIDAYLSRREVADDTPLFGVSGPQQACQNLNMSPLERRQRGLWGTLPHRPARSLKDQARGRVPRAMGRSTSQRET
ncbi:MAG: hypothetical protein ACUVX9_08005 [Anaerolineae bacterium]